MALSRDATPSHTSATRPTHKLLAMVIASDELRTDTYAAAMIQSFAAACRLADTTLAVLVAKPSVRRDVLEQMARTPADGFAVFAPSLGDQLAYETLTVDERPVVFVGRTRPDPERTAVDVENRESSAKLVGHLLDTAGPRVAMIAGAPGRLSSELRLEGFRMAHASRDIAVDESLIVHGNFTRISGYQLAGEILQKTPDGIFCANDEMGLGVALAASERGIELPRDLSLAGFDGSSAVRPDEPRLTSADQPFDLIASAAVQCVLDGIEGKPMAAVQLLDPPLRFGWSTHASPRPQR